MTDRGPYRSTHAALLDDPDFRKLPAQAKHILLTIKHTRLNNMAGIFICDEGGILTLATQCGYSTKAIRKGIETLSNGNWVKWDGTILWVRNQLRFEPGITLNNQKHISGVENILKSLPKLKIVLNFCDYYGLAYPFDTPSIPLRNKDTETDTEKETETDIYSPDENGIPYTEIVTDLNLKANKNYRVTDRTKSLIRARWNEGFRLPDFQRVHAVKVAKWHGDPQWEQYIRPQTLYGPKFEGYLNERLPSEMPLSGRSERSRRLIEASFEFLRRQGYDGEGLSGVSQDVPQIESDVSSGKS